MKRKRFHNLACFDFAWRLRFILKTDSTGQWSRKGRSRRFHDVGSTSDSGCIAATELTDASGLLLLMMSVPSPNISTRKTDGARTRPQGRKGIPWFRTRSTRRLSAGPSAQPVEPTFRNSWPYFAFLLVVAVALYYAKWPILIIAALVGFFRGLFWLCHRFPRTMFVIMAIVRGLMGKR